MPGVGHSPPPSTGLILYLGAPVKLRSSQVLNGYNIYHSHSVIRQRVTFGALTGMTSSQAGSAFGEAFVERFGGLRSFIPKCGLTEKFITRLSSGEGVDYSELLLEAIVAIENSLAFAMHDLDAVDYAAVEPHSQHCDLIWACSVPKLSRAAAEVAVAGLLDLLPVTLFARPPDSGLDFDDAYERLLREAARRRLSPTTSVLKQAARRRGLPCETSGRQHLRLGQGEAQRQIYASLTGTTSITAQKVCADKRLTNRRLDELRLPVPPQVKVGSPREAQDAAMKIGFPIVIKPVRGKKGSSVSAGLISVDDVDSAFALAHEKGADVLVERFIQGRDYRLLVIGGRFVAALTREQPSVTGDGVATVDQLIDRLNAHPWRDGFRLFQVKRDIELERMLTVAGVRLEDVLDEGRTVGLRSAANVSTGGVPIDVTDEVHPDNRAMAERAAQGIGLDIAGIDFITNDIGHSFREAGGGIIEVNARPGLCMHTWPLQGRSRNVAGEVLKLCVPPDTDGRIPIVAVAGDKGTGATARSLDRLLRGAGRSVALALRTRAFVNGASAELSQSQQSKAAKLLLRDPQVGVLVGTVSPRRTARRGLFLDHCAVTVIHDREKTEEADLFSTGLGILVRATTQCFIVDAGNSVALERIQNLGSRELILVSERFNNPSLRAHVSARRAAVTTMWERGAVRIVLFSNGQIASSFNLDRSESRGGRGRRSRLRRGTMFAIAAAHGLGMSGPEIAEALERAPPIVPDD